MSTKARSTDEAMWLPLQSVRGEQVGQIFAESELDYAVAGIQVDAAGVRSQLTASPASLHDLYQQCEPCLAEDLASRQRGTISEPQCGPDAPDAIDSESRFDGRCEGRLAGFVDHGSTVQRDAVTSQVERRDVP